MKRFEGKVVLVTGGNRNTGIEITDLFIREGAKVFMCGSTPESTAKGEKILRDRNIGDFRAITCDISDLAQVTAMFDVIEKEAGRLDILVNNAAHQGLGQGGPLEMDPAKMLEVFKVNLVGGFQVTQMACNRFFMKQEPNPATNQRGVVVTLGSNTSLRAIRNRTSYVTSKGGIDAMVRSLALDLGPLGIRVNEVAPGYIYTERWDVLDEKIKARRRLNCPLRKEATGGDIADAVAFLASDAARNIGGERLVVDAGCSAQHMPEDVDF